MIDVPQPRDIVGPAQLQQIQRDLESVKDCVRAQRIMPSPTVRPSETSSGTFLEASASALAEAGEFEQYAVIEQRRDYLLCRRATLDATGLIITLDTADVRIAKPHELRCTPWNTADRVAAGLSASVNGYKYVYSPVGTNVDIPKNPFNARTVTLLDASELGFGNVSIVTAGLPTRDDEIDFVESIWPEYIPVTSPLPARSLIAAATIKGGGFTVTETDEVDGYMVETNYAITLIDKNLAARRFEMNLNKVKICTGNTTVAPKFVLMRTSATFQQG